MKLKVNKVVLTVHLLINSDKADASKNSHAATAEMLTEKFTITTKAALERFTFH